MLSDGNSVCVLSGEAGLIHQLQAEHHALGVLLLVVVIGVRQLDIHISDTETVVDMLRVIDGVDDAVVFIYDLVVQIRAHRQCHLVRVRSTVVELATDGDGTEVIHVAGDVGHVERVVELFRVAVPFPVGLHNHQIKGPSVIFLFLTTRQSQSHQGY